MRRAGDDGSIAQHRSARGNSSPVARCFDEQLILPTSRRQDAASRAHGVAVQGTTDPILTAGAPPDVQALILGRDPDAAPVARLIAGARTSAAERRMRPKLRVLPRAAA